MRVALQALCLIAAVYYAAGAKEEKAKRKTKDMNCTELFSEADSILRKTKYDKSDTAESWRFKRNRNVDKALKLYKICYEKRPDEKDKHHLQAVMSMAKLHYLKEEGGAAEAQKAFDLWPEDDRGVEYYWRKAEVLGQQRGEDEVDYKAQSREALEKAVAMLSLDETPPPYAELQEKLLAMPIHANITDIVGHHEYGSLAVQSLAMYHQEKRDYKAYTETLTLAQMLSPFNQRLKYHIVEQLGKLGNVVCLWRAFAPSFYDDYSRWAPAGFARYVEGFFARIPMFVTTLARELVSDAPDATKASYLALYKERCGVELKVEDGRANRQSLVAGVFACMEKQGMIQHIKDVLPLLNYSLAVEEECEEGEQCKAAEVPAVWTLKDLFAHNLREGLNMSEADAEFSPDVTLSHYVAQLGPEAIKVLQKYDALSFQVQAYNGTTPALLAGAQGAADLIPDGEDAVADAWKRSEYSPCWTGKGKKPCYAKGDGLYLEKMDDVSGDYEAATEWGRLKPPAEADEKAKEEYESYQAFEDREDFNEALYDDRLGRAPALEVDYVTYVNKKKFVKEYLSIGRPVILGESQPLDDASEKKQQQLFDFTGLARHFGKTELPVVESPQTLDTLNSDTKPEKKPMLMWSIEDAAKYRTTSHVVHMRYPWKEVLTLPEAIDGMFNLNSSNFKFIGGASGSGTGMQFADGHFFDHLATSASRRTWLIVPPSHAYYTGATPEESYKTALELRAAGAPIYEFQQVYGDTVYVPAGWSYAYLNLRGGASYSGAFPWGAAVPIASESKPLEDPNKKAEGEGKKEKPVPEPKKTQPITPAGDSYGEAVTEEEVHEDDVVAAKKERKRKIAEERKEKAKEKAKQPKKKKPKKKPPTDGSMYVDDDGNLVGSMVIGGNQGKKDKEKKDQEEDKKDEL
eukprot:TRINITY_DN29892_c0_g1_i1.p1 TRINITY_DN29892_c0_g1~~TRINITY_DN29892_c0_g1_i1.p1  ORF type:complete len:914 (+),score=426.84 TRINITY_DN29892_c0_g1_i1:54-2795(+)